MAIIESQTTGMQLPTDKNAIALQILAPAYSTSVNGTVVATSQRVTIPTNSEILFITNTQDMWVAFGTSGVTAVVQAAGTFLLLAGERPLQRPSGVTHLAVIRNTDDGLFSVTCLI